MTEENNAVAVQTPQFVAPPDLSAYQTLALEIEATVTTLAVTSEVERGIAAEWLARGKLATKEAEAKRRELLKPLERDVGLINETFKSVMSPITRAVESISRKIGEWTESERLRVLRENQEAERKRREAEAEVVRLKAEADRLEAEAAKLKAEAEAAVTPEPESLEAFFDRHDAGIASPEATIERIQAQASDAKVAAGLAALAAVPQPMQAAPPRTVETSRGVIGTSTVWTWEFVPGQEELIPREYLMVDQGRITRAVKGGTRTIPGIRIFPKGSAGLRAGS